MIKFTLGCIHTLDDCKAIISLVQQGKLPRINSRSDICPNIIGPNQIYVYIENESNIKRWTDKRRWTPSRVFGCFLMYQEMNGNLCKKAFSEVTKCGKFHIVAYSTKDDENHKLCCEKNASFKNECTDAIMSSKRLDNAVMFESKNETKYRQVRRKPMMPAFTPQGMLKYESFDEVFRYCFPEGASKIQKNHFKEIFTFDELKKDEEKEEEEGEVLKQLSIPSNENLFSEDIEWQTKLKEGRRLFKESTTKDCKDRFSRTISLNDNSINENKTTDKENV